MFPACNKTAEKLKWLIDRFMKSDPWWSQNRLADKVSARDDFVISELLQLATIRPTQRSQNSLFATAASRLPTVKHFQTHNSLNILQHASYMFRIELIMVIGTLQMMMADLYRCVHQLWARVM